MLPLYAARIEDLGHGDLVKIGCANCHHVALLTQTALLRAGLSPAAKVLDLKGRFRCRGYGRKRFDQVAAARSAEPATGARDERHSSKIHLKPRLKKRR